MEGIRRSFYYISLFADMVILVASFSGADIISRGRLPAGIRVDQDVPGLPEIFTMLLFLFVWYFSSKVSSLYDELKNFNLISEIFSLLKNIFIQLIAGVIVLFSIKDILLSRFFLMMYLIFVLCATLILRSVYRLVRKVLISRGRIRKNVLVVGGSEIGKSFFGTPERAGVTGIKYLGKFSDLGKVLEKEEIDEVLIALEGEEVKKLDQIMNILSGFPVRARIIPDYFKFISNKYQISFFNNVPVIDIRNDPLDELHWRIVKRGFDILFSIIFIIFVLSWLGPVIAFIIKTGSRGHVLFNQERWGRKNKRFVMYKFRSMVKGSEDIDKDGKFIQATKDDARVTKVGKFLRRTSLDELPQFFNVLKGDMSVIGPRPHAVPMNIESKDKIKNYMLRHLVKPGITGWAQVNGLRGETSDQKLLEKRIAYDMFYIENWSFWFDLRIIFLTVWRGIRGDPNAY